MCLIIGHLLSNVLTAGFPGGWVENRGFLCLLLLFDTCISWGTSMEKLLICLREGGLVPLWGLGHDHRNQNKSELFGGSLNCGEGKKKQTKTKTWSKPCKQRRVFWRKITWELLSVGLAHTPPQTVTEHLKWIYFGLGSILFTLRLHWRCRGEAPRGEELWGKWGFVLSHLSCLAWSCI